MSVKDIYAKLKISHKITMPYIHFLKKYDTLAKNIYSKEAKLYPKVKELFIEVKKKNFSIGICYSTKRRWITLILKRYGLEKYVDKIVSFEDIEGNSKPDPEIYFKILEKLSLSPKECISIEDSFNGILASRTAGIYCVGYYNKFNHKKELRKSNKIICNFSEIPPLLKTLP